MSAMEERTPTGDASCFEDDMAWRYGLESARLLVSGQPSAQLETPVPAAGLASLSAKGLREHADGMRVGEAEAPRCPACRVDEDGRRTGEMEAGAAPGARAARTPVSSGLWSPSCCCRAQWSSAAFEPESPPHLAGCWPCQRRWPARRGRNHLHHLHLLCRRHSATWCCPARVSHSPRTGWGSATCG